MNLSFIQLQHLRLQRSSILSQCLYGPHTVLTRYRRSSYSLWLLFVGYMILPLFTFKSFHNDLSAGTHQTYEVCIAGLIQQSPLL